MVGPAIDKLRQLIDSPDDGCALRACADVISRVNGLPVATSIVALNAGQEVRKLGPAEIAEAAKLYLLRQNAAQADDVLGTGEQSQADPVCQGEAETAP